MHSFFYVDYAVMCIHNTGCWHWFNTLNGGPMVASVGMCGTYLCMGLQKVNVIYRNNAECSWVRLPYGQQKGLVKICCVCPLKLLPQICSEQ